MFTNDANGPDCWKCALNVEWHDCSWCPVILLRQGIAIRNGTDVKPLPTAALLPNPARRKNLFKPMKKTLLAPRRFRAGFTLVELLTVIAIIGILAAMLLPVLAAVKKHAQVVKAKKEAGDILIAIEGYDQAYGRFPVSSAAQTAASASVNGNKDFTYGGTFATPSGTSIVPSSGLFLTNSEVIAILMDITNYPGTTAPTINNGHVKNPQQTKFLNQTMVSDTTSPGIGTDLAYRDPWGHPYIISMDLNYDDQCMDAFYALKNVSQQNNQTGFNGLVNSTDPSGNGDHFQFHGKIMVWSAGPDGKIDPLNTKANTGVNKDNVLSWQ
jgi:prepilin-type N-terminal cleavage/methylation domain-containing protein